ARGAQACAAPGAARVSNPPRLHAGDPGAAGGPVVHTRRGPVDREAHGRCGHRGLCGAGWRPRGSLAASRGSRGAWIAERGLGRVRLIQFAWLLLLLAIGVLPAFLGEAPFASLGYSLLFQWTPERRLLDYLRYMGASDESAKEVKLFGLSSFLVGRYSELSDK